MPQRSTRFRNSDSRIRDLQRRVAQGEAGADVALLQERIRVGELELWRARVAAAMGDASSAALFSAEELANDLRRQRHSAFMPHEHFVIRALIPTRSDQRDAARVAALSVARYILTFIWEPLQDLVDLPEDVALMRAPREVVSAAEALVAQGEEFASGPRPRYGRQLELLHPRLGGYHFAEFDVLQDAVRVFHWIEVMNAGPGHYPYAADASRHESTAVFWLSAMDRVMDNAAETIRTAHDLVGPDGVDHRLQHVRAELDAIRQQRAIALDDVMAELMGRLIRPRIAAWALRSS